ncbi:DinB family protein [Bacillus sp. B-jedd]|uniref:DinB family protein n=1 Tax=Bacillus sp. B-jedd TaxID=1476857 RepID=UPI0005156F75|nr:DinB family protein [Bacillus sp. B-jedd]CEG27288.1 DinB family protein [Bacillus sp. B-jedd]
MKKHPAAQLYDYHVWANKKFFGRLKELPEEIYETKIQSVFSSIAETLVHIFVTDTLWLGVMKGKSMKEIHAAIGEVQEKTKDRRLEIIETLYHELSVEYQEFLQSERDLDKEIFPEHPKFGRLETNLAQLIQHVVNHGTYHRGNLAAMIRQQGYSSVATDYVFYLYEINGRK